MHSEGEPNIDKEKRSVLLGRAFSASRRFTKSVFVAKSAIPSFPLTRHLARSAEAAGGRGEKRIELQSAASKRR